MSSTPRPDGRTPSQMRPVSIETGVSRHAEGSALISLGETRVMPLAMNRAGTVSRT